MEELFSLTLSTSENKGAERETTCYWSPTSHESCMSNWSTVNGLCDAGEDVSDSGQLGRPPCRDQDLSAWGTVPRNRCTPKHGKGGRFVHWPLQLVFKND